MAKHELEIAAEAQGIAISDSPDFLNKPQDAPAPSPEPEPSEPQATQPNSFNLSNLILSDFFI